MWIKKAVGFSLGQNNRIKVVKRAEHTATFRNNWMSLQIYRQYRIMQIRWDVRQLLLGNVKLQYPNYKKIHQSSVQTKQAKNQKKRNWAMLCSLYHWHLTTSSKWSTINHLRKNVNKQKEAKAPKKKAEAESSKLLCNCGTLKFKTRGREKEGRESCRIGGLNNM